MTNVAWVKTDVGIWVQELFGQRRAEIVIGDISPIGVLPN